MSSAAVHQGAALACGAVTTILAECPEDERLWLGILLIGGGLLGAKLPDVFEPAIHSHHRKFFHSLVVAGGLAWAIRKVLDWPRETREQRLLRAAVLGVAVGYASHLALDAMTPRSLPLI
jgi:inner membrane protein